MKELYLSDTIEQLKSKELKTEVFHFDSRGRPLVMLNWITSPTKVEVHDLAVDITQIISGRGILQIGGEIVGKKFRSAGEWRGLRLKNSENVILGTGKVVVIPAGTPHQTSPEKGEDLIYLTYKHYLTDNILTEALNDQLKAKISRIKGLIMDVDGTMTDGKVLVNEHEEEFAVFSRLDGMGIELWQKFGYRAGIISKEKVSIATARAKKLQIDCHQGVEDKLSQAKELVRNWGLGLNQVCFVGDDVNDVELLKKVNFSACPSDAQPEVLRVVDFVLSSKRGQHVIRELTDLILSVQGKMH